MCTFCPGQGNTPIPTSVHWPLPAQQAISYQLWLSLGRSFGKVFLQDLLEGINQYNPQQVHLKGPTWRSIHRGTVLEQQVESWGKWERWVSNTPMSCVPVGKNKRPEGPKLPPHLNPLSKYTSARFNPASLPFSSLVTTWRATVQVGGRRSARWDPFAWGTSVTPWALLEGHLGGLDTKGMSSFSPQLRLVSSKATARGFSSGVPLVHQKRQNPVL